MAKPRDDRLFVPLSTEPFRWFATGGKRWELRRYGRQYTEKHVVPGRVVELRRGYQSSRDALWGTVAAVEQACGVQEFFDKVPFREVIPIAYSREDAVERTVRILGLQDKPHTKLLGFRVSLRP